MAPAGLAGVIETTLECVCDAFQPPPANKAELQQQVLQVLKLAGRAPRHNLIHVSVVSFTQSSSAYLNLHSAMETGCLGTCSMSRTQQACWLTNSLCLSLSAGR